MFLLTSIVGFVMKRDMSAGGNILTMLLLGWLVAWMFSFFFPKSNFNWALNFIGIILFVGLTAWDTQRLKQIGQQAGNRAPGGLVVVGAADALSRFHQPVPAAPARQAVRMP